MEFEVRAKFPVSVEKLFDYFVYWHECDQWMEYENWNGLVLMIGSEGFSGFEIPNPDPRMAPLAFEVDSLVQSEHVIYKSSEENRENVHADSAAFFPFRAMKQSLYFSSSGSGSEVLHKIELTPRGIIGWLTCRFIVKPQLISGLHNSIKRLEKHLNS